MDDLNLFRQCGHLRLIDKFSADSEKRLKVQATDTLLLRGEPGGRQSFDMFCTRIGYKYILECRALLRDLQITVTLVSLKVMVELDHQVLFWRAVEPDFSASRRTPPGSMPSAMRFRMGRRSSSGTNCRVKLRTTMDAFSIEVIRRSSSSSS